MSEQEYDESHPHVRVALALESIARNLEKLAHPPICIPSYIKDTRPGAVNYRE